MIKQTIYSSSRVSVKGNSIGFQFITYSNTLDNSALSLLEKNNHYYRPSYLTNEVYTDSNKDLYPTRYQYSKIDNMFVLGQTKYIGQEQTSNREGNFLSHQLIKDNAFISNPIKYFLNNIHFIDKVPNEYLEINTQVGYLNEIDDQMDYSNHYFNFNDEKYTISLLSVCLEALKNNQKVVVLNNDSPLELISDLSLLLPKETIDKLTFNTYIDNTNELTELLNFSNTNNENVTVNGLERLKDVVIFNEEDRVNSNSHLINYLLKNGITKDVLSSLSEFYLLTNNKDIFKIESLIPVIIEESYELSNLDDVSKVINEVSIMRNDVLLSLIVSKYLTQVLSNNDYSLLESIFNLPGFSVGVGANYLTEYFKNDFLRNEENIFWISKLQDLLNSNIFDLNYILEILTVFNDDYYLGMVNLNNLVTILKIIYTNSQVVFNNNIHILEYYLDKIYQSLPAEEVIDKLNQLVNMFDQDIKVVDRIISIGKLYSLDESFVVSLMEDIYLESIIYNKIDETLVSLKDDEDNLDIYYSVLVKYFGKVKATTFTLAALRSAITFNKNLDNISEIFSDSKISNKDKLTFMEDIYNNYKFIDNFSLSVIPFINNIDFLEVYTLNKKLILELFKETSLIQNNLNLDLYCLTTKKLDNLSSNLTNEELSSIINYLFDNEKLLFDKKIMTHYFNNYDEQFKNHLITKFNSSDEKDKLLENFIKLLDSITISEVLKRELYIVLIALNKGNDNKKKALIEKRLKLR